jgi:hypothetical protein
MNMLTTMLREQRVEAVKPGGVIASGPRELGYGN